MTHARRRRRRPRQPAPDVLTTADAGRTALDPATGRQFAPSEVLALLKRRRDELGDALTLYTRTSELEHARRWLTFIELNRLATRLETAISIHELIARTDRAPINLTAHIDALNRSKP